MPRQQDEPRFDFEISHKVVNGENALTITPVYRITNYKPKTIILSDEQWSALRYHFLLAVDDKAGITKLAVI